MPRRINRSLNATKDVPDFRDYMYEPALVQLQARMDPPEDLRILDQFSEGACTGFSLAACINHLYQISGLGTRVSARMLYEMAKRCDEWPGEDYDGSSLRGAINGWKNMGVCEEWMWKYRSSSPGELTVEKAQNARRQTVGAYYRLKPEISHFHAALNEVGIIACSAKVHKGWFDADGGTIEYNESAEGGHAFAIVGYNEDGFWVQNSWGHRWGRNGLALWSYEDWVENVMDAWVFRLALPTPQIFGMRPSMMKVIEEAEKGKVGKAAPQRREIAGHFVHIDDGRYKESGKYWSTANDVAMTAARVVESKKYRHFLVYAHGGLNSPGDSATRIAAMKDVFKQNGIYPFHIMYDTGLVEELKDLIWRKDLQAEERVGGFSDWTDRFLEGLLRRPGALIWDEMKRDAGDAFASNGAGTDALNIFIDHFRKADRKINLHMAGHSTGGIVLANLLDVMRRKKLTFGTCSLMAPACTIERYDSSFLPVLQRKFALRISDMTIYNLKDKLERDDSVAGVYRKSLLYLVSNAFEREYEQSLLGMERHSNQIVFSGRSPAMVYSNGINSAGSRSTEHGGFDNDVITMNHILQRILKKRPSRKFTKKDLEY